MRHYLVLLCTSLALVLFPATAYADAVSTTLASLSSIKDLGSFVVLVGLGVWVLYKGGPAFLQHMKNEEEALKSIAVALVELKSSITALDVTTKAVALEVKAHTATTAEGIAAIRGEHADLARLVFERTDSVVKQVRDDGDKTRDHVDNVIPLAVYRKGAG